MRNDIDEKKKEICNVIIKEGVATVGNLISIQQSIVDYSSIFIAQTAMIIKLGKVFDIDISENQAEEFSKSLLTSFVGSAIVQATLGFVPTIGMVINSNYVAKETEKLGWKAVERLSENQVKTP